MLNLHAKTFGCPAFITLLRLFSLTYCVTSIYYCRQWIFRKQLTIFKYSKALQFFFPSFTILQFTLIQQKIKAVNIHSLCATEKFWNVNFLSSSILKFDKNIDQSGKAWYNKQKQMSCTSVSFKQSEGDSPDHLFLSGDTPEIRTMWSNLKLYSK